MARDQAAVDRAVSVLPPGARLLLVQAADDQAEKPPPWPRLPGHWVLHTHGGTRAVMTARAFVPTLFTAAGKKPVFVRAPWARLSVPAGMTPLPWHLEQAADPALLRVFPYLADWRQDFGYLLLLDAASPGAEPLPEGLDVVADEGFAQVYRIR